jgi:hypothetical protein
MGAYPDPGFQTKKPDICIADLYVSCRRNARVQTKPAAKASLFEKIVMACTRNNAFYEDRAGPGPVFVQNDVWCTRRGDFFKKQRFRCRFGLHSCVSPQRNTQIFIHKYVFLFIVLGVGVRPPWGHAPPPVGARFSASHAVNTNTELNRV